MIPKFKASMGPGVRRHGLRILQILTDHLVRSKAKFLRDLPSFVGVLLCASRELSIVASVNGQEGSVLTSLAELVEVLQNHIRNLEGQFGRLVPTACSFWLKVLKYSASEHLCGRKIHFGGVGADSSVWSPTRLILENNTANFCATQSLFQQVILRAMDDICREERTSVSVTYAAEHDALLRGKLMPHAIDAVIHMLHCRWGSHPPPAAILTGVSLPLQQVRLQRVASSNNTGVGMYCAASLYELTSLQSTLSIFYARHTLAHLAAAGSPASLLTPAVEATLTRAAYEAARCTSGYIELLSSCLHPLLCAAERGRLETEVCGTTRFGVLHVELMVQLTAQVAGICMAWPESSFKEKCCGELKRVCDVLRRVTRGNHASAVSAGRSTRLLIRVVGIVLDRKVMNESELDSLFREEAARSIADDDVGRADKLQHLVMAAALLQLVSSFSLSSGVLQDFVTTLHVDTNVIAALQKNADVFTGLVVVWLATFGAPASLLSRLAGHHLPLTSQLIEHIEGLLSFTFSTDGCFTTASAELQAILCSTDAPVELVVLSSLAALRRRELHLTDWKTVGTTALNGVVSAVPHRWDLALAVARGYPLLSTAPQQDDEGGQGGVAFRCALLQERLVTVAQSCGPWPRGVALQVLLEARYATASAVEKGGGKTTPASVLADFVELLEATSNLDARVMCRGFTLPRVWEIGIPPLVKFVRRKHLLEYRAVSIVLGTVQEQNDDDNRRYVLRSLLSCNSDTLFLALDHMFASAHGNKFLSSWRGGRSKKFIWSQDVCLSAFPWDALTSDAQHLVMWSWASPKLAEMAWGQTGKERPDSAVDSVVSMLATLSSISSSAKKSQTTTGIAIPITLSFPRALFNIAWASGVFKQHVSSFDAKDRPVTSSHLQSFGGCTPILGTLFGVPSPLKVSLDGSLLSIPCGFSAVQYVYASTDGDGLAAAERGFLLFLAGGCHSMEEITNALLKRMVSEPPTLEVVLAAWNVFCIRRVELGFAEVKEPKDPLKELPLKPSDVAVFIALVVRASCDDWNCSPKPDEDAHRQQRQRRKQLISEMFIHGGVAELSEGKCRPRGLTDGTAFRRACTRAAVAAVSIVKQHDQRLDHFTDASCFDSYIDSAF
ncbi:unnamed protein product [Trypanosoma congolense IL3000]|uniref:WGS project CAEQ00000000 data, annotated contig 821 n=1 Tax=Trypanosoma congolense (strain IL3000) TaxID=1068625 RepID=F9WIQ4_TRYCI|nr:unnamed protein product [Trypanosoma congolense IL3000]